MKYFFPHTNIKSQTAVEYLLLFTITAIIVFTAFKTLVPKAQVLSNTYYNKVAIGIMGDPPDSFAPLPPGVRIVYKEITGKTVTVSCDTNEYLTGGGCYWREMTRGGTDDAHGHPTVDSGSTLGAGYYCEDQNNDTIRAYAICSTQTIPSNVYSNLWLTNKCPAGEVLTGGGCYMRKVQSNKEDNIHWHPYPTNGNNLFDPDAWQCQGRVTSCGGGGCDLKNYIICSQTPGITCTLRAGNNAQCNSDEYLMGGGCYWKEVERNGTDDVSSVPAKSNGSVLSSGSTLGIAWHCESNKVGLQPSYIKCCKFN